MELQLLYPYLGATIVSPLDAFPLYCSFHLCFPWDGNSHHRYCLYGKTRIINLSSLFIVYQARRSMRTLRGLLRLRTLMESNAIKRQTTTTLRCMQTLSRIQTQIRTRRIRKLEHNHTLQRQIQLKREKELEALISTVKIVTLIPSLLIFADDNRG